MYAVIRTGNRQYRVKEGDVFNIEKIPAAAGESVVFGDVLAVGNGAELKVGRPNVAGARVAATVVTHARAKKVIIFKFRRTRNYMRKRGHRQDFTRIRINSITAG